MVLIFINIQNQQVVNKQHELMNYYYYDVILPDTFTIVYYILQFVSI